MGIPINKTLVISASPSRTNLAIWVRVTGDAHITRVLGTGKPKTRGCPYHCDNGSGNENRIPRNGFQSAVSETLQ